MHAETIDKIRARTAEAMSRPEVVERVKTGLERRQQVHSEETKVRHAQVPYQLTLALCMALHGSHAPVFITRFVTHVNEEMRI